MLQRDHRFRTQLHQLTDACVFAVAFWLAFALRGNPLFSQLIGMDAVKVGEANFDKILWLYLVIFPAAPLILESQGFYNRTILDSRPAMFWPLLKSCFIVTMGLILIVYVFKLTVPRGVMTLFGVLAYALVWAKEEALRLALKSKLAKAQYKRRIVLAGTPWEVNRLRRMLKSRNDASTEIAAEFNISEAPPKHLIELLHEHSISGVLISARHTELERVESLIQLCEIEGVEAWLVADFFATQIARASFDEMFGHPLLVFRSTPEASWQMLIKTLIDFFGAAAVLLILTVIPVIPIVALLVKFTSPGPVFFRQQRSGLNGAPFSIFKFRTMTTNAEQLKHELAAMNEMSGPVFKITNDPRVTPIGKLLRKFSLDEFPQLFNVLRGEMSLVGPRPLPVDEVKRFNDLAHRRRLSVKPGLTCLWQVNGRNKITNFQEWVRLDLEYIDNWSIWLDIKILLRTIPAVFAGTGAK
ncbi:MAG TPA: sugar transferase [Verrucomicrobiae bacterium]|jgi:exopolysaccharide biosynthesis polyprenyl glycosylphosphotransferase